MSLCSCSASCQVSSNSVQRFEKSKMCQLMRGQGGYLGLLIGPKNTNLVEDVVFLLPVKFRRIPSGYRGEVENVSANQRPERPSLFSDRHEKNAKFVEDVVFLLPVKCLQIPLKSKMSQPIRGRSGLLGFPIG